MIKSWVALRRHELALWVVVVVFAVVAGVVIRAPAVAWSLTGVAVVGAVATHQRWWPWCRAAAVWHAFGRGVAQLLSLLLLGLLYYGVVTPTGLARRAVRRSPLTMRPDATAPTYWLQRSPSDDDVERLLRPY